jgi:hypothetical protein
MEVVAMNVLKIAAALLLLAGCQHLPPVNPEQTAEQRLVNVCRSIDDAIRATLTHNIDLAALTVLEDIKEESDVICSDNGWMDAGLTVDGALRLAESYLVRSLAKQREAE